MKREIQNELESTLSRVGVAVGGEVLDGIAAYQPLLEAWSKRVRLVGSTDPRTVAIKHFADSLTLVPLLSAMKPKEKMLDIGSGAGFPGIPLALARPDLCVTLVEADYRKASFLLAAAASLKLENVQVVSACLGGEPLDEGIQSFELVVSRALMDLESWLELGRHYLSPNGSLVAMMGSNAPDDGALRTLGLRAGLVLESVWRGELSGAGDRVTAKWRIA